MADTQEKMAVQWKCPNGANHVTHNVVEHGVVYVPVCRHCRDQKGGRTKRCVEGTVELCAPAAAPAPTPVAEMALFRRRETVLDAAQSEVFGQFVRVLDAMRVISGGGTPMTNTCVLCEGRCGSECICACHPAWELRRRVEAIVGKAA